MAKDLVFKLVLNADVKSFVTNTKQSEQSAKNMFSAISESAAAAKAQLESATNAVEKTVSDNAVKKADDLSKKIDKVASSAESLEQEASQASQAVGDIVTSTALNEAQELSNKYLAAAKNISDLGDKSTISAGELLSMSNQGEQGISRLKTALQQAEAELVRLQSTDGTMKDIEVAKGRVLSLEDSVKQVSSAFNLYQSTAINAMKGVDAATQQTINDVQRFSSVDLSKIVSEVQTAKRAIESLGTGAELSTKDIQRFGDIGVTSLKTLERELVQAEDQLKALNRSTNIPTAQFKEATARVTALENAIILVRKEFGSFKVSAEVVDHELKQVGNSAEQAATGVKLAESGFGLLKTALATLGLGVTANELMQTADAYKNLTSRIQIAIGEHGNLHQAMSDVIGIALKTNSDLEATGTLYAKITKAAQDLNKVQQELFSYSNSGAKQFKVNQQDILQITESLNKATQISGSSAETTAASLYQLGQSLSANVLRGEEFNSVMEGTPRIAQAIADGLGVTTGQLKAMADAGQLTTNVWLPAFLSQASKLNSEFANFPLTIGAATNNLKTSWTVYLGELDKTYGISANVAKAIQLISENLGTLASVLKIAAEAAIAYKAIDIAQTLIAKANAANLAKVALTTETQAIVANTAANLANANAAKVAAAAHQQTASVTSTLFPTFTRTTTALTGFLGRLGTYGAVAAGAVAGGKAVADILGAVGTSAGEGAAKLAIYFQRYALGNKDVMTLEESEAKLEAQQKRSKAAADEATAAKRRDAAAAELAKNASLGLNTASKEVVAGFDQLVQSGTKVTEALKGVAGAFSFDSTTGINNGITALMALLKQGKATGDQVKTALSNALDGQDLVVFETNFSTVGAKIQTAMDKTNAELKQKQQAYDEWKRNSANLSYNEWSAQNQKYKDGIAATQAQANTLQTQYNNTIQSAAMVHGAVLDQAIKRTGMSYEELSGKSTKAFISAKNDVDITVASLDELKARGVDTGKAVGLNINKAIEKATNQSELDGLKAKVQGLRGELGTKVADGLLQQIEQKMLDVKAATDQALPGINSVAEAFSKFGIETKEQAQITSQGFIDAFNTMKSSGKATAEQLKQALVQMADQIYASGDSAKKTWYENELAINGLTSKVDEFGKVSVSSLSDISSSANQTRQSFSSLGDEAESDAERSASAWENAADRVDNAKSSMSKKGDSSGSGSGQMSIDGLWANQNSIKSKLTGMGYDDAQATELSQKIYNDSKGHSYTGATKASWDYARRHGITDYTAFSTPSSSNTLYVNEQLDKYKDQFNRGRSKSSEAATSAAADAISNVGPTKTIKLEAPDGKTATMTATPTQADTLESILGQLGQHKKSS